MSADELRLLSAVVESTTDTVVISRADGQLVYMNRAGRLATGVPEDADIARYNNRQFYTAEGLERVVREARPAALRDGSWSGENQALALDGREYEISQVITVHRDARGEPEFFSGWARDITKIKRADRALRESEARLSAFMEHSPSIMFIKDTAGRYLDANRQFLNSFGLQKSAAIGHTDDELFPEEQAAHFQANDARVIATGEHIEAEESARYGEVVHTSLVNKFPIPGPEGRTAALGGIVTDISEFKRLEKALSDTQLLLEIALEGSSICYWDADLRTGKVTLSASWAQFLGNDPGITRTTMEDLLRQVHPEDAGQTRAAYTAGLKGEIPGYFVEARTRSGSGGWKWFLSQGKVIERDADGRAVRMCGTNTDITREINSRSELRRQRRFLQQIIDTIPSFVFVRDREGRYVLCNLALSDFCGRRPEEMIGKTNAELGRPAEEVQSAMQGDLQAFAIEGRIEPYESLLVDWQGRPRWFENNKTVLADSGGVARQVLGVSTEITRRKELEERLRQANDELERRVAERTASLEASARELESLAYAMSHDLRTPLRAINAYTQLLAAGGHGEFEPKARDYLERIRHNSLFMSQLVDGMLEFMRVSRVPIERQKINVTKMVQPVADALQDRGRTIRFNISPLSPCHADPELVKKVFEALISNAVKFTRSRAVAQIDIGEHASGGEHVYYVRDNGVGFEMTYVQKLFGMFQRLHADTEFEGTGVNLAIVQRIITRHGGRIWAEGEAGKGAGFYFTLVRTVQQPKRIE
jgi:PAS domain S-box-containing protein